MNSIGEDEEMHYLLKLHHTVQRVKGSNNENRDKIVQLKSLFDEVKDIIVKVQKAQSKSAGSTVEKKKEDPKKSKK